MLTPRIKDLRRGDPIMAAYLNQIVDAVIASIEGGEGIQVQRLGDRIVVSLRPNNRQIVPKT